MTKIAIIEDNQTIGRMYGMKFEADGFEVRIAIDGKAGVDLVKTFNPDIILLAADGNQDAMKDFLHSYPILAGLKASQSNKILNVRSEALVAGMSVLTLDEALRLQNAMQQASTKQ